jgi:hypothetical protein
MWIPRTPAELTAGLVDVQETSWLEFKREFPSSGDNADIATDIGAMSTDGGVIIYGVAEDKATRIFSPAPIILKGCSERLSQVVASRIAGSPSFECFELGLGDGTGYLVVAVPLSPSAPHVVENGDTRRTYGRSGPRNVELSQGDLDRLFDRRRKFESDEAAQLELARSLSPIQSGDPNQPGVLNLVIRPIGGPSDLVSHVLEIDERTQFHTFVANALNAPTFLNDFGPSLTTLLISGTYQRTSDGVELVGAIRSTDKIRAHMEILRDGTIRLNVGSVTQPHDGGEYRFIRDDLIARFALRTAHLASRIYEGASYFGPVDISYVVRDCSGAFSNGYNSPQFLPAVDTPNGVSAIERPNFRRVTTDSLRRDKIQDTMTEVLNPFLRPIRALSWQNPLLLSAISP